MLPQKIKEKGDKAFNSPQVSKERMFHIHLLVESYWIVFRKYILRQGFKLSFVLNLFLIFHQISGLFSHKIVLIKRVYMGLNRQKSLRNLKKRVRVNHVTVEKSVFDHNQVQWPCWKWGYQYFNNCKLNIFLKPSLFFKDMSGNETACKQKNCMSCFDTGNQGAALNF